MRKTLNFNQKWAFSKEAAAVPAKMPETWVWVNLPHTWNDIDGMDGGNDYYRGTCYYAKEVDKAEFLPAADAYYLEFDGANSSATVYVDGKEVGHHDGGYSTFRVNVTEVFQNSAKPLVVVAVDNGANETVYPQMADFTFYGGLYRDVKVICVNESHFDLDFYGGKGLKITPEIHEDRATVEVKAYVQDWKMGQKLEFVIRDQEGSEVASDMISAEEAFGEDETDLEEPELCLGETESDREELERDSITEVTTAFTIPHVHLWHGRKDPYLYSCEVKLVREEDDEALDSVSSRFGCRTFSIDANEGFLLNGESYPLHGVSRHQDRWGKGNALTKADHEEDMDLICEMGANTIRLAHYQHAQDFYDLCDERGMVVWAEIPYISKHMETGRENTISQMKELIAQNYNHPSIVVWGLSNEISMQGSSENLLENHHILNDLCHEWDPTRKTVIACVSPTPIDDPYIQIPDAVSYNHYYGWYGGDTSMNGPWFDKFHEAHPEIPIGMSEYGCEALNWHNSNPTQGDYSEEYQAYYHEELIEQLFSRKYIWATHVWNMFDFGADARAEGGENGQNHKGLVTMDRKYKKDSFYAYKAWLSDEPFVHICGKRYVDRVEDVTKVTVYSNQPEVELFVNGVSLGKQDSDVHFFYFDVPNEGESVLEAIAGECHDRSMIRKVETFNEAYRLQEKGAILNWFDVEMPEGYLSINDKISDISASEEGKKFINDLMMEIFRSAGADGENKNSMSDMMGGEGIQEMLGGFTLLRFTSMAGMMNLSFTKEQLLEMNAKLNKIKK